MLQSQIEIWWQRWNYWQEIFLKTTSDCSSCAPLTTIIEVQNPLRNILRLQIRVVAGYQLETCWPEIRSRSRPWMGSRHIERECCPVLWRSTKGGKWPGRNNKRCSVFFCAQEISKVLFSTQNIPRNWGIRSKSGYHSPGEKKRGIGSRQQPHHSSCGSSQRRCCSGKFSVVEQLFSKAFWTTSLTNSFLGISEPEAAWLWGKAVAPERDQLCEADRRLAALDRQLQLKSQGARGRGELGAHHWGGHEGSLLHTGVLVQSE